ncbi:MAG TPA: cytoplasmic protein [Phycisphaerales bacterium]|nr:cytoplasmic protein [Phycisphaerales bacterium]HCD33270.1 cytoplasmic protein [Phycisphaerales bacterium]|tara:strand:- start:47 stop:367 length:321 start_codon:yes stop_codon:yes gene_type:complete
MPTTEQFISESITPDKDTLNTTQMARGEPGLPQCFTWRDTQYTVAELLDSWKESGKCTHGSEMYLRKHWFEIRTVSGEVMKIYFERKARSAKQAKQRWWLYTMSKP